MLSIDWRSTQIAARVDRAPSFYFHDVNGNVGQLIDWRPIEDWETLELSSANDWHESRLAARYEYDPYGNSLLDPTDPNESGPYAASNRQRGRESFSWRLDCRRAIIRSFKPA